MNRRTGKSQGFTIIELLAVVAINGVLASLLLAAMPLESARERARQNRCRLNLKHIYTAMIEYGNDYDDFVVPTVNWRTMQSWPMLLKPYLPDTDAIFLIFYTLLKVET